MLPRHIDVLSKSLADLRNRPRPRPRVLRRFALSAFVVFVGCASNDSRLSRVQELQEASRQVAAQEDQCMAAAVKRANDAISKLNGTDQATKQQIQSIDAQRSHDLAECKTTADSADQALSARELAEYQHEAEEQRARVLMLEVITGPPP